MNSPAILRSIGKRGGWQLVQTDTLKIEYVQLPITDTLVTFIYRILEPFPLAWTVDSCTSAQLLAESLENRVKRKARERFIGMIHSVNPDTLRKEAPWIFDITKSSIQECEIVPIQDPDDPR